MINSVPEIVLSGTQNQPKNGLFNPFFFKKISVLFYHFFTQFDRLNFEKSSNMPTIWQKNKQRKALLIIALKTYSSNCTSKTHNPGFGYPRSITRAELRQICTYAQTNKSILHIWHHTALLRWRILILLYHFKNWHIFQRTSQSDHCASLQYF